MEQEERNPLLEPENYFKGYEKSIDELKSNPEVIAFDKLCYEVFEATEIGKKFIEFAKERFFVYTQVDRRDPNYRTSCVWQEGFRDAYRMMFNHIQSHKQRIAAQGNK